MKTRNRIAAAVAVAGVAAIGTAHAQSSVTIGGWLNIGAQKKTDAKANLGTISRSSLTFSGSEDLGGGLSTTFRLGTRFELDTGTNEGDRPYFQQESTVGLKSTTWGQVRLGRALSPIGYMDGDYEAWAVFDRISSPAWWFFVPDYLPDAGSTKVKGSRDYGRVAHGIFYDSPSMGGVSVHLSTASKAYPEDRARHYGASVNYDVKPVQVMLATERNTQNDKAYFLGTTYKFSNVKLMAGYSYVKLDKQSYIYGADYTNWAAASNPTSKRTSLVLSSTIDIGASSVLLGAGRDFQGSTNGFNFIGSNFTKARTNYSGASNFFGATYLYNLSKRTSVFVDASYVNWKYEDDNGRRHATGMAVGINHGF